MFFSRVNRTSYQGKIIREEVLDWSEEILHPHGERSPPINVRKVELEAWVVIEEVRNGHWGIGGQSLGIDDVRRIIAS